MTEPPVLAVGLMSGTSLDGMDAALVRISGPTRSELVHYVSRPYAPGERSRLLSVIERGTPSELARVHVAIAELAVEAVEHLLEAARVRASDLGLIAFHGQTVWHEPPLVSWQLGEPALLAERFGVRVVSNFRGRDVAAGGQGAPLVPMADVLLFGHPERPRILLNIGGMANLTFVPRRASDDGAMAFDTGPGMVLIDGAARVTDPTLPFDRDGRLARSGQVVPELLTELLADPFFATPPPRSTGRERYGSEMVDRLCQQVSGPDAVRTAVELTARTVSDAVTRWVPPAPELVVSGGGARHPVLMERLQALLGERGVTLVRFDDLFFSGDAKEAVAFAHLGYLTLHGQPGNLPSATGARGPRILGQITPP